MTLRLGVMGVGYLGRHHARILSSLPGIDLVAVVDINTARAAEVAAANRTRPLGDFRELLGQVDAVTIAVPTELHRDIAIAVPVGGRAGARREADGAVVGRSRRR